MESVKYTLKEKFFKITPENTIGRTSYSLRMLLIWLVFYIGFALLPLILIKTNPLLILSVGLFPLQIVMYSGIIIFLFSAYILSVKRTNDFGGKLWVPKAAFLTMVIIAIAMIFDLIPEGANIKGEYLFVYIIYLSAIKPKAIETPEIKTNPLS